MIGRMRVGPNGEVEGAFRHPTHDDHVFKRAELSHELRRLADPGVAIRSAGARRGLSKATVDFIRWRLVRWADQVVRGDADEIRGAIVIAEAATRTASSGAESMTYCDAARLLQQALRLTEETTHAA
jgi:hypothetical protein